VADRNVDIRRASPSDDDLDLIAPLFDAYRQFYALPSDRALARQFLSSRLRADESIVFFATRGRNDGGVEGLGFVQLYRSFSSLSACRILVLNDLYVVPDARGLGIGRRLMGRAHEEAIRSGARQLTLTTATTNATAQALYRSLGYEREEGYEHYTLRVGR
jgi:ribosomal protein S18 acetylase RimI-like enzyme